MNVAQAPSLPDQATTCLNEWVAEGRGIDVLDIFTALQTRFRETLDRWRTEGFEPIRQLWESEGPMRGEGLRVGLQDGTTVQGAYNGLAGDGALRLRLASGEVELVYAGDVSLIEDR